MSHTNILNLDLNVMEISLSLSLFYEELHQGRLSDLVYTNADV